MIYFWKEYESRDHFTYFDLLYLGDKNKPKFAAWVKGYGKPHNSGAVWQLRWSTMSYVFNKIATKDSPSIDAEGTFEHCQTTAELYVVMSGGKMITSSQTNLL